MMIYGDIPTKGQTGKVKNAIIPSEIHIYL